MLSKASLSEVASGTINTSIPGDTFIPGTRIGISVSGAGDVNADGVDDVIISTSPVDSDSRNNSGSGSDQSYVIYGRSPDRIDVQGRVATTYVENNKIVGNAFNVGESYQGLLLSNTDNSVNANDVILGTAESDNIWAGTQGNDAITSGAGSDIIGIGSGDASVIAGAGDDFVYAIGTSTGNNIIDLGAGNDSFWATAGNNMVTGTGNNLIAVGSGNSTVMTTGDGNDFVYSAENGEETVSVLRLGDGDNTVWLPTGSYFITTGNGSDIIGLGEGSSAFVNAGDGDDIIYTLSSDDTNSKGKTVYSGAGNDYIQTGGGDDFIDVSGGDNLIDGGLGFNQILGGSGIDTLVISTDAQTFIRFFEAGSDLIQLSDVSFGELSFFEGASSRVDSTVTSVFIAANGTNFIEVFDSTVAALNNAANFV